ncbi:MAG: hypothetical protein CSA70_02595 [Rhodobacterales bacterium]|nr:MAG: hypothetical protein CSA70_02595 [Rhodobacterales bacterium]
MGSWKRHVSYPYRGWFDRVARFGFDQKTVAKAKAFHAWLVQPAIYAPNRLEQVMTDLDAAYIPDGDAYPDRWRG